MCGLAVRPNFRRQGLNAQNMYKDLGRCHSNDPYDLHPTPNHKDKNSTKLNRVIQHASVLVHVHWIFRPHIIALLSNLPGMQNDTTICLPVFKIDNHFVQSSSIHYNWRKFNIYVIHTNKSFNMHVFIYFFIISISFSFPDEFMSFFFHLSACLWLSVFLPVLTFPAFRSRQKFHWDAFHNVYGDIGRLVNRSLQSMCSSY